MIKPPHINARLTHAKPTLRPPPELHRLKNSKNRTPNPYLAGAELYIPKPLLYARPNDVPLFPPRPPPRPSFLSILRSLPIFRLATGGFTFGALATFMLFSNDQDEQKDRVDIGTFDGREGWLENSDKPTFTYTYKGGKFGIGGETTSVHALMSEEETEAFLKRHEEVTRVRRPGNPVIKIDENVLPSKTACEDRHAIDIVSRADINSLLKPSSQCSSIWDIWARMRISPDEVGNGKDDLVFVSVFDGHMGSPAVAELLKKTFHACLSWMIAASSIDHSSCLELTHPSGVVGKAIHDAFLAWDNDLIQAPLHLLNGRIQIPEAQGRPGFPHPSLVALADAASRGSTAVSAVIDAQADMLHVAHCGDSRAVAGWWNPETNMWRCDVLTEDHDVEHDKEADLVRSRHAPEEGQDVVCDMGYWKRILGAGQPSRAMANTSFKLSPEDQARDAPEHTRLVDTLGASNCKFDKPVLTPPYMSAEPEIASRSIHPPSGEELKFLVLASDGLWDWTTSEEAALLLTAHLNMPHSPDIPKELLPAIHTFLDPPEQRKFPAEPLPGSMERSTGERVFEDTNAATHLIRNALGGMGWDRNVRRKVLSMREGGTRVVRDDTTVVVVWFGEPAEQ